MNLQNSIQIQTIQETQYLASQTGISIFESLMSYIPFMKTIVQYPWNTSRYFDRKSWTHYDLSLLYKIASTMEKSCFRHHTI